MLENFIFSINVSLPIFIIMLIGMFLKRKNILGDDFFSAANTLVFQVALPAKLFMDTATSDFSQAMDPKFLALAIGGSTVFFLLYGFLDGC